jgi:hypothetical protein
MNKAGTVCECYGGSRPATCSASSEAVQYADYVLNHYARDSYADKLCLARDLERHGWEKSQYANLRDAVDTLTLQRNEPTDSESTKTVNAVGIRSSDLFGDLSADAKQAVAWLFSDHAKKLSVIEARACILEGWGKRVDDELRAYFSPNAEAIHGEKGSTP